MQRQRVMGERQQSLQVLRAVAALGVLLYHATWAASGAPLASRDLRALGAAGVDLFFVVSGAVIYLTAFERPMGVVDFIRRRFIRVAPIYWLVTIAVLVLLPAEAGPPTLREIATTLTFWPVWSDEIDLPILLSGWTLSYEMLFYASAALVLVSRRWLWVLGAAYAAMWASPLAVAGFLGNPMILEFVAGVVIMKYRERLRFPPLFSLGLLAIAVGFFFAPHGRAELSNGGYVLRGRPIAWVRLFLYGVPAILTVWASLGLEPYIRGRWAKVASYLGDASYSIYLVHWPLCLWVAPLVKASGLSPWFVVPAVICVGIAGGCGCYELLEKPLLRFLRPRPKLELASAQ